MRDAVELVRIYFISNGNYFIRVFFLALLHYLIKYFLVNRYCYSTITCSNRSSTGMSVDELTLALRPRTRRLNICFIL